MVIPQHQLGGSGLSVSAVGLGCMGMSEFYGSRDDDESVRVINHAIDIGITFLDTADVYGIGHNERLVGRAIRNRRAEVVLATKFGNVRGPDGAFLGINGKPAYVQIACDASLKRLGVDCIDLYYLHRVDPDVPVEDTVGAMAELVKTGKVRHIGLSEAAPGTLRRAQKEHKISALQTEYSLWTRDVEDDILPVCRELQVGFVAYSPLGRGFLTGAIQRTEDLNEGDWRRNNPRFQPENLEKNLALVQRIREIAAEKKATPSQLALAWLLARGQDVVPIPGTKRMEYVDENVGALRVELSAKDLERIDRAIPPGSAAGERYPAAGMKAVNR